MKTTTNLKDALDSLLGLGTDVKGMGKNKYQMHCPAHDDDNPSLSVELIPNDKILIDCKAGCDTENILHAAGLEYKDLFADNNQHKQSRRKSKDKPKLKPLSKDLIDKLHNKLLGNREKLGYLIQTRNLTKHVIIKYQIGWDGERYCIPIKDKEGDIVDIRRYSPDNDPKMLAWEKGRGSGAKFYPVENLDKDKIFACEGPLDTLAAISAGVNALTWTNGVKNWKSSWSKYFKNKHVTLALDNDQAGKETTKQIIKDFRDTKLKSLQVIEWPKDYPKSGDISDWFNDHDLNELRELAEPRKPGVTVKPVSLEDGKEVFHKWLELEDDRFIDVILAIHLTTRIDGDPAWLFLLAPPGSGKTEILRTLTDLQGVYSVSSMTDKSLVSGKGKEASLAPKIHKKTFIIKDFSPILSMKWEKRNAIFSDLRDSYDGYIEKKFGNQEEKQSYDTHFSLVAGATPALDKFSSIQSSLGERFLKLRIDISKEITKEEIIDAAMENVDLQAKMRKELRETTEGILANVKSNYKVNITKKQKEKIKVLARVIGDLRTGVDRDSYSKDLNYLPESESGARPAIQLSKIAIGLAWLKDNKEPTEDDLEILAKIAIDSIHKKRTKIIAYLVSGGWATTSAISEHTEIPRQTTERELDDLVVLGLVSKTKLNEGRTAPWNWRLKDKYMKLLERTNLKHTLRSLTKLRNQE